MKPEYCEPQEEKLKLQEAACYQLSLPKLKFDIN